MAKLIQFSRENARRRALKRAGATTQQDSDKHQLNLFGRQPAGGTNQPSILSFTSPFARALYMDEQNHPGSAEAYEQAIEQQDHVADALCNLAIIHANRHEDVKAIDALSAAIAENGRHTESHYNLANIYLDNNELNLARLHYELAVRINPDFPEVYFNLGLVYLIKNQRTKAVEMLQRYEEMTPGGLDEIQEILKRS